MSKFQFHVDWFTEHVPLWKEHVGHFAGKENVHFLEIGSWEGRSACWQLENILTHPTSTLTCIDPFCVFTKSDIEAYAMFWGLKPPFPEELNTEEIFHNNIAATGMQQKVIVHKDMSQNVLPTLPHEHYDCIYVDGSHWAPNALADGVLSWPLLRNGGVLIFDDYELDMFKNPVDNANVGIDAFLSAYQTQYELLHVGWQIMIRKTVPVQPVAATNPALGKNDPPAKLDIVGLEQWKRR